VSKPSSKGSALGDLAGIIGGPVVPAAEEQATAPELALKNAVVKVPEQPFSLPESTEHSDRITAILPISLLSQLETRVASLRRKKKVSISGYIEAALRELLATGEHDLEALERHHIKARRDLPRVRPNA
jgi:hypothetical protein